MNPLFNKIYLKQRRKNLRIRSTHTEKILWQDLRRKKILGLKFYRQYSIGNFILDFFCPKISLAIELDGITHEFPNVQENDRKKNQFLKENKIQLLRIKDKEFLSDYMKIINQISDIAKKSICKNHDTLFTSRPHPL